MSEVKKDETVHASESPAASVAVSAPSLAMLLSRHVLRDGEIVLLILKPSVWYILFSSLRFLAAAMIVLIGIQILREQIYGARVLMELVALLMAGRVMWAVMQWMGRLYVLTDLRIMRVEGVFQVDIFDCPLRKVARTRVLRTTKDLLAGVGTIEIIPKEENLPIATWGTVARPVRVHDQVVAAINRAKLGEG